MRTRTVQDYRDTQSGPCLIVGNGPSLIDFPFHSIGTIPSFACNFLPLHAPAVHYDYLVMTDKKTMLSEKLWKWVRPEVLAFCFQKWAGSFPKRDNIVWWMNKDDPIEGFSFGDVWGQYFPTSAHAACWIADVMGFDDIYLVGMDGTSQQRELSGVDEFGKSTVPHFYDDHPGKDSMLWDIAWGNMAHYLARRNKTITNLSSKTAITQLIRRNHLDFFEADTGRWKRSGSIEHPGQVAVSVATILNELVADTPPHYPDPLDSMGHVVADRGSAEFAREYLGSFEQTDRAVLPRNIRGG